jgi:exodeoxyribonuclease VII small subunit
VGQASGRSETAGAEVAAGEAYDALVARLERVVAELEGGQLTLEASIERFADGVRLAREASRKLDDAERRVELLVRSADGADEAVPFEPESGKGA